MNNPLSVKGEEFIWNRSGLSHAHAYILPVLEKWLSEPKAKRVLDMGCGNGALTCHFAAKGYDMVGADSSKSGIECAERDKSLPVQFINAGVETPMPPTLSNSFDTVIAVEVIEHLFLPRQLFERARESLGKKGGRLIVTTPYHGYIKNIVLALSGKMDSHLQPLKDFGHIKFFSLDTLKQMFVEEGFKPTREALVGRVPALAKSMMIEGILEKA